MHALVIHAPITRVLHMYDRTCVLALPCSLLTAGAPAAMSRLVARARLTARTAAPPARCTIAPYETTSTACLGAQTGLVCCARPPTQSLHGSLHTCFSRRVLQLSRHRSPANGRGRWPSPCQPRHHRRHRGRTRISRVAGRHAEEVCNGMSSRSPQACFVCRRYHSQLTLSFHLL